MIQCPNCGGYKLEGFQLQRTERPGFVGYAIAWILILSWVGIIFGLALLFSLRDTERRWREEQGKPFQEGTSYTCSICGYQWLQRPGETLPIRHNPDLIRMGDQRLREEEEQSWD